MIRFRNRRATLLPSTLSFALMCQAGLAFAQSPEGWPFEEKQLNPTAPANQDAGSPPAKSPVQQRLEELYRRDNRPLPDYMQNGGAQPAAQPTQPRQPQQNQRPQLQQASQQQTSQLQAPQLQAPQLQAPQLQAPQQQASQQQASQQQASQQQAPQQQAPQQQAPQQQASQQPATQQPAYQQQASEQPAQPQQAPQQQVQVQPAPARYYPVQPPAPLSSPYPVQDYQASQSPSQQSIRQQLAEYYASQGKAMPGMQPTWNSADTPRQPVALDAGQGAQSGSAATATPQQPLIQRLNPFRGFWHKDDSQATPPATASSSSTTTYSAPPAAYSAPAAYSPSTATTPPSSNLANYGKASSQSMSSQNGVSYSSTPAPLAPVQPQVVYTPTRPAPAVMTVDLGQSVPISSIQRPASDSSKPTTLRPAPTSPQPSVASRTTVPPTTAPPAKGVASAPAAPAVAAKSPAPQSQPSPNGRPAAPGKVAVASDHTPFDRKSESDADKKTGPYSGVSLQDTDEAVTGPNASKVTTANDSEPADRPRVAPTPAVDVEPSHAPAPKASTAAPAVAAQRPATQPAPIHVAQSAPALSHAPAAAQAPKPFTAQEPAGQVHASDSTDAKMHQIGERVGQRGLKGFCPVALREHRELVDALPIYSSTFESQRYYFSSAEAKSHFDQAPHKYAPVAGGIDVVVKGSSDRNVEGTLDHAVWYKDHLFLFGSPESLEAFSANPLQYASPFLQSH
jgi:YHS domain-containing protein